MLKDWLYTYPSSEIPENEFFILEIYIDFFLETRVCFQSKVLLFTFSKVTRDIGSVFFKIVFTRSVSPTVSFWALRLTYPFLELYLDIRSWSVLRARGRTTRFHGGHFWRPMSQPAMLRENFFTRPGNPVSHQNSSRRSGGHGDSFRWRCCCMGPVRSKLTCEVGVICVWRIIRQQAIKFNCICNLGYSPVFLNVFFAKPSKMNCTTITR